MFFIHGVTAALHAKYVFVQLKIIFELDLNGKSFPVPK